MPLRCRTGAARWLAPAALGVCVCAGTAWAESALVESRTAGSGMCAGVREPPAAPNQSIREPYPLDTVSRLSKSRGRLHCDMSGLVLHRSSQLRYEVRAHPAFSVRLRRFEAFVTRHATAHYGRAPRRLVHSGVYSCRRMRGREGTLSEHALGNALDLVGFDFSRLDEDTQAPAGMPKRLRHGFSVRVAEHWSPEHKRDLYHARFLQTIMRELRVRPDIFRGLLGPPMNRHHNHLHLDMGRYRFAAFESDARIR